MQIGFPSNWNRTHTQTVQAKTPKKTEIPRIFHLHVLWRSPMRQRRSPGDCSCARRLASSLYFPEPKESSCPTFCTRPVSFRIHGVAFFCLHTRTDTTKKLFLLVQLEDNLTHAHRMSLSVHGGEKVPLRARSTPRLVEREHTVASNVVPWHDRPQLKLRRVLWSVPQSRSV